MDINIIDKELDWKLNPKDSHAPVFYRLPKIYELNTPIRSFVLCATEVYRLSRYVASILTAYAQSGNGTFSAPRISLIESVPNEIMIKYF